MSERASAHVGGRRDRAHAPSPTRRRSRSPSKSRSRSGCTTGRSRSSCGRRAPTATSPPGFLLAEGVIASSDDLGAVEHCRHPDHPDVHNVVNVFLLGEARRTLEQRFAGSAQRHGELVVRRLRPADDRFADRREPDAAVLRLDAAAVDRGVASGAAAIAPAAVRRDRGPARRRAVHRRRHHDRLRRGRRPAQRGRQGRSGRMLLDDRLPLADAVLAVSGRTSFEIVQKAWLAGVADHLCRFGAVQPGGGSGGDGRHHAARVRARRRLQHLHAPASASVRCEADYPLPPRRGGKRQKTPIKSTLDCHWHPGCSIARRERANASRDPCRRRDRGCRPWWWTRRVAGGAIHVVDRRRARSRQRAGRARRRVRRPRIVFDRHGQPAFTYFVEQRIDVPLDRVSPHDDRRACSRSRTGASSGTAGSTRSGSPARRGGTSAPDGSSQGGSTITQQLARAAQLSPGRTFERKIREIMIAARLEERYSKREILEEYLNTVYFGEGYYGVEAASRGYFGKSAADLEPGRSGAARRARPIAVASMRPASPPARATRAPQPGAALMQRSGAHLAGGAAGRARDRRSRRATRAGSAAGGAFASNGGTGLYFQEEAAAAAVRSSSATSACCAAACASIRPTIPTCSARPSSAIATRIAQIAKSAPQRPRPPGQPGVDEPARPATCSRSSAAATSWRAASTAPPRRAGRPGRRSSRSSMRRRSSAAMRQARC